MYKNRLKLYNKEEWCYLVEIREKLFSCLVHFLLCSFLMNHLYDFNMNGELKKQIRKKVTHFQWLIQLNHRRTRINTRRLVPVSSKKQPHPPRLWYHLKYTMIKRVTFDETGIYYCRQRISFYIYLFLSIAKITADSLEFKIIY